MNLHTGRIASRLTAVLIHIFIEHYKVKNFSHLQRYINYYENNKSIIFIVLIKV